jgi:flagellar assembly factor FliW
MEAFNTKNFGRIQFDPETAIEFPAGIPGFEQRHRFLALSYPDNEPLVFLQSLEDSALCFITLPVLAVQPAYRLKLSADDLSILGLPATRTPRIGNELLCLVIISVREDGPTANLLAPVVINLKNRKAMQAVVAESDYSHQHRLLPEPELAECC